MQTRIREWRTPASRSGILVRIPESTWTERRRWCSGQSTRPREDKSSRSRSDCSAVAQSTYFLSPRRERTISGEPEGPQRGTRVRGMRMLAPGHDLSQRVPTQHPEIEEDAEETVTDPQRPD